MSVNKVILLGNLGDDVKMHYFEGGGSIGRFSLATNKSYKNKEGERVTETEWHNVVSRNKTSEIIDKYFKKGDEIYLEGEIKTRKWQDDKGMDRYSTEINLITFSFVGSKSNTQQPQSNTEPQTDNFKSDPEEEDDLPF